jgi:acetylornithine deacetylase/succinyl-diaminopimelate desuccinylase-like protein
MSSDNLTKIYNWLDAQRDAMIADLVTLVEKESVFPNELPVQRDVVEPMLRAMAFDEVARVNLDAEAERPFVVGAWRGSGGGRALLLNGHIDTVGVPGTMGERWTTDPWKSVIKDGRLYGRGSSDMKAGVVAMLWAVKALQTAGIRLRGDVLVEVVPGEETMRYDIGTVGATNWFLERGYTIPFAIVTEPTHLEIHSRSVGLLDYIIEISGKEIHTAMRNLVKFPQRYDVPQGRQAGVDAISHLARMILRLEDLERQWAMRWRHPEHGGGGRPHPDIQGVGAWTINNTFVQAGTYVGSVPGYARIDGNISYPSWLDADTVRAEFERVIHLHAQLDDWLRDNPPKVTIGAVYDWPPHVCPDTPALDMLARAVEQVGHKPIFSGTKYVADAAFLQRECDIPAVYFGPGDCSMGVHGPNEYVPLAQVIDAAKAIAAFMIDWCG